MGSNFSKFHYRVHREHGENFKKEKKVKKHPKNFVRQSARQSLIYKKGDINDSKS